MKKLLFIILILPYTIFSQNLSDEEIKNSLVTVSNKINESCPQVIDKYITLVSTLVIDKSLKYMYVMDPDMFYDYNKSKSEWLESQNTQIRNYYCTSPEFSDYRKHNIKVTWRYSDLKGSYLGEFTFDNKSCK